MLEIENPYLSPYDSSSSARVTRYRKTSRLKFLFVVGLILSLSFSITLIVADRNVFSYSDSLAFFGLTIAGPFMTLGLLFWGPGPLAMPIWGVAVVVCFATFYYLVRPNNVSLVISLIGAVAWAFVAPILIVVLPELHIRI